MIVAVEKNFFQDNNNKFEFYDSSIPNSQKLNKNCNKYDDSIPNSQKLNKNCNEYNGDSRSIFENCLAAAEEYSIKMKGKNQFNLNEDLLYGEYQDIDIVNKINALKKRWKDFADILSQISFFKNEFHRMLSMRHMFEYIINDKNLFLNYWDFIVDISSLFFKNFDFKLQIKDDSSFDEKYNKEYKEFSKEFFKKEKFFYTKIYKCSNFYDNDILGDISNLLVR